MSIQKPDPRQTNKKPTYPVGSLLRTYLATYAREVELPVSYERLLQWSGSIPLYNDLGEDTLWQTVIYPAEEMKQLARSLTFVYALLKTEGDASLAEHLYMDRIDYCSFGNSNPFRIRIVNSRNENQDYYYVKKPDASRIYGLELEHLLSPNRIHYLTDGETLVEEHISGIPGDVFIERWLEDPHLKEVRVAKELVKFNERCFVRLLGDMRSYNFVVEVTPDFEEVQVRIRAMDFDQQSYSGKKRFYLPQFFKDNLPLVEFCLRHLDNTTARQYQREEQALINRRAQLAHLRLNAFFKCMCADRISTTEKVIELRESLAEHYQDKRFRECESMGDIVRRSLDQVHHSSSRSDPLPVILSDAP